MTQPQPTTWVIHLAAQKPWRALEAILLILLALFVVAALGAPLLVTVLSAILLFSSVAEFLLPVTYTLDAAGAHAYTFASRRTLGWAQVRRVYLRPNGIKLSPLVVSSWAEPYRGVFLRTPNREAMLETIQTWLKEAGVTPEIVEGP